MYDLALESDGLLPEQFSSIQSQIQQCKLEASGGEVVKDEEESEESEGATNLGSRSILSFLNTVLF